MRNPHNDRPAADLAPSPPLPLAGGVGEGAAKEGAPLADTPSPSSSRKREGGIHDAIRTCVLSREEAPRDGLVRLVLGPDNHVHPDVRAKAPGRGAWIGVTRAEFEAAYSKGKLRGGLARAFKTGDFTLPDDLGARIEDQLRRNALDRLGLESKAGFLVVGGDRIEEAARSGKMRVLLHAADAGTDGIRRLAQAWRVGSDREGSDLKGLVLPVGRTILSLALGRENVVHAAVTDAKAAKRVSEALTRWLHFIGPDPAPLPCETGSQGASPHHDDARGPAGTNEGFRVPE